MQPQTIAVLIHKNDTAFFYFKYLIKFVMKEWEALGFAVKVVRGIDRFVPADVVVPHLDLTIVPDDYREFLARYPIVINRQLVDISKSRISCNIIRQDDPYPGPVIVKTDFNSGGLPETRLSRTYLLRALKAKLTGQPSLSEGTPTRPDGWAEVKHLNSEDYSVFPTLKSVPESVFGNTNLVVEKFLPENHGDGYCVRYHTFLGGQEVTELYKSDNKVVKGSGHHSTEAGPVPPEIHQFKKQMGIDYGKIDFVIRDGLPIVFDVSRTPGIPFPTNDKGQLVRERAHQLARGIYSFLK